MDKKVNRQQSNQEKNLNAATLGTLFFATYLLTSHKFFIGFLILGVLLFLWSVFEWVNWFHTRRKIGNNKVLNFSEIIRNAFVDIGNSVLLLAIVVMFPSLILIGAMSSGTDGALIGLGSGLIYIVCMFVTEKYPLDY